MEYLRGKRLFRIIKDNDLFAHYKAVKKVTDGVCHSVYGVLLVQKKCRRIPFKMLHFGDLRDANVFVKERKLVSRLSGGKFRVGKDEIKVGRKTVRGLQPFLRDQFIRLIEPKCFADLRDKEPRSAEEEEVLFNALRERYTTQSNYDANVLRLIDKYTDLLCAMPMYALTDWDGKQTEIFCRGVRAQAKFWLELISDLINGRVKRGDDLAAFYELTDDVRRVARQISVGERFPALIDVNFEKLTAGRAFSDDDTAVLPYLLACMDFPYLAECMVYFPIYAYMEWRRQ